MQQMSQAEHTVDEKSGARNLCWACREESGVGPFCTHCVKIQPIADMGDYYALFGLEPSYTVDPAYLKRKFYELSRQFHPDYYAAQTDKEQLLARDNTAYVNTALKVLTDPLRRAEYLLCLKTGHYSGNPAPPQELFEEILEAGELLENDNLTDAGRTQLVEFGNNFRERQHDMIESLGPLFDELLSTDNFDKKKIESRLDNIKYIRTILTRIDKRLGLSEN
jgi:molecular chaperone HscB